MDYTGNFLSRNIYFTDITLTLKKLLARVAPLSNAANVMHVTLTLILHLP